MVAVSHLAKSVVAVGFLAASVVVPFYWKQLLVHRSGGITQDWAALHCGRRVSTTAFTVVGESW